MQRFIGRVIGTAMQKTAKVCVERLIKLPKYPKVYINPTNNYVDFEGSQELSGA